MENKNKTFNNKIVNATKWSTITEVSAKLISPITNMILARLLVPEAFGVIATITMITSFVEMFTDAGFQKYLVQRNFKDANEKHKYANVAFLTNFGISILLWFLIILFNEPIASLVGNPGLGIVIIIACIQLPITSFSSIQMSLYRRAFDFKTLFLVRIISVLIPIIITIPLALYGFSYWSLIIGNISTQLFNAIILTIKSEWRPSTFFQIGILKNMLSFSIWSLIEAISIWFTVWIDTFIISSFLNSYYLGLYKTSTVMVNALLAIVTASIVPVLFSTLSRLQNDEIAFKNMYYKYQKFVAYIILPLGIGLFIYSDVATSIMLGSQWSEASEIIGIWALTSSIVIVTTHFNSEVYRSKGKPKLSFMSQLITLCFLIPTCLISIKFGFWALVYSRALIRLQGIVTGFILMKYFMNFPIIKTLKNISKPMYITIVMSIVALILRQFSNSLVWNVLSITLCISMYCLLLFVFAKKDVMQVKRIILKN